jgi:hypothetical protein
MAVAGCELFVGMTPYLSALNRRLRAPVNADVVVDLLLRVADLRPRVASTVRAFLAALLPRVASCLA